jgi:hypothetical protein
MFRMAVGHSDDVDLEVALEEVFATCDAGLAGLTPQAGLLLASWASDYQAVIGATRRRYPGIQLAGSSTAGEVSSELGFVEDSIELAVFASDSVDMTVGLGRDLAGDAIAATRAAARQARAGTSKPPALCIALPNIGGADTGVVLAALREELGAGVPVLGGGASTQDPILDPAATQGIQLANDTIVEGGIALLLFSGPLTYSFGVDTGWRGVGPRAVVTSVVGGLIHEIDGRPAVEFFDRFLGSAFTGPPIANPLAVYETAESTDFHLRTATSIDRESGDVAVFGPIDEGVTVQLTMAGTEEIIDGARTSIGDAVRGFPEGRTPDAALMYSCVVRRFLLGTRATREIELLRELVGRDVPVAGFYCMGEIAPLPMEDVSRFHNATMVSVLLGSS